MLSLVLVLLVILGGVNAMSYRKIVQDAGHILELLSENRGAFPKALPPDGETGKPDRPLPPGNGLSPEAPFESRFFSVLLDGEGQVLQSDTGQIAAVDDQSAGEMAQAVWETGHTGGFWEDYRYVRVAENGGVRFIFLDCGRSLSNFRTTLLASVLVALSGLLAVFLLLLVLSRRIVRPVAESYEKQRRFITDAGHELKTPLTIIGADLDLVEPELEGNEWLQDIRCQVRRLAGLTPGPDLPLPYGGGDAAHPAHRVPALRPDGRDGPVLSGIGQRPKEKDLCCPSSPCSPIPGTRMPSGSFCPFCWTTP